LTDVGHGRTGAEQEAASAERVARNEAMFREANEAIRDSAASLQLDGLLPALCECAEPTCTELVRLTPAEYEGVRAEPRWFLGAVGHQANAEGWARVVAETGRYVVVEKIEEAGEIAEQLDPRGEGSG
jgi:hypothetical protein